MTLSLEAMAQLTDEDWTGANPLSSAFRDNPYPALHRLRERDPVNLTPLGFWRVTRYADVVQILKTVSTRQTLSDGTAPNFDPEDRRGSFHEFLRRDVQHLAFGGGPHFCLGHQLARMEGRAAIGEFFRRIPAMRIADGSVAWSPSFFRVLGSLPVVFG